MMCVCCGSFWEGSGFWERRIGLESRDVFFEDPSWHDNDDDDD